MSGKEKSSDQCNCKFMLQSIECGSISLWLSYRTAISDKAKAKKEKIKRSSSGSSSKENAEDNVNQRRNEKKRKAASHVVSQKSQALKQIVIIIIIFFLCDCRCQPGNFCEMHQIV